MYDFISVKHVSDLGTVVIEDIRYNDKVIVCDEHIPQLISELNRYTGVNDEGTNQWFVTYRYNSELVKCLFETKQDAINYLNYIDEIFRGEAFASIDEVQVKSKW